MGSLGESVFLHPAKKISDLSPRTQFVFKSDLVIKTSKFKDNRWDIAFEKGVSKDGSYIPESYNTRYCILSDTDEAPTAENIEIKTGTVLGLANKKVIDGQEVYNCDGDTCSYRTSMQGFTLKNETVKGLPSKFGFLCSSASRPFVIELSKEKWPHLSPFQRFPYLVVGEPLTNFAEPVTVGMFREQFGKYADLVPAR